MIVDYAVYEDGLRRDGAWSLDQAPDSFRRVDGFTWVDVQEPTADELDSLRTKLGLGWLDADPLGERQRPRLEAADGALVLVVATACRLERENVDCGRLLLAAGDNLLVSLRRGPATPLDGVRAELERRPERLRLGSTAALAAALERVIDDYAEVAEQLEEDIDSLEELVFSTKRLYRAERLYGLLRAVLRFHRAVVPLPEALERLAEEPQPGVADELRPEFRRLAQRAAGVVGEVERFRGLLGEALQVHQARASARLAQVSVRQSEITARQNEDMRKISAWVAIIATPTAIAGIYGMNFRHMPELDWAFGYPLVLAVMLVLCLALHRYFRHIHWL
jgi:magnesium transporter